MTSAQAQYQAGLSTYLAEQVQAIDQVLDQWVPAESMAPASIHQAMRYSLFAGGKRIRPILAIAAARAVSDSPNGIENAAATLELIHTYSLIHDDLPALDNDDLRRGRPTCHKVFGEAMAILAGDSLLTLAFEVLSRLPYIDAERKIRLVEELARASGTVGGMIGGQVHDIEGEKTSAHRVSARIHPSRENRRSAAGQSAHGRYLCRRYPLEELSALSEFGERVGLAFQIIDDVLDVEESSEKLGKTAGKDAAQQKITFPAVYGLERSRQMAEEERLAAHTALHSFDDRAGRLRQIADFIVQRKT